MAEFSPHDMASKLLSENFGRNGPMADVLTDPIADTPMVVTLDELRPYELDPRLTRNPLYDEIKASIRERGLDAPPPITRRPGADHYIIRNGGNTRLAILRELWAETKDERFFRIACLFRPWPERGEIVALTGHLAENELHGGLSFIERALGVEKVRELYEQEDGKPLSQSELARRLKADGYPVPQPHISRMQEAIQYLLPAIPNILYGGLGRHQVEQLTSLRRAGARVWEARASGSRVNLDFPAIFQDVLASFDAAPQSFSVQRAQDELIGQMADLLSTNYDTLAFEITDSEKRWKVLTSPAEPSPAVKPVVPPSSEAGSSTGRAIAQPPAVTSHSDEFPLRDEPSPETPAGAGIGTSEEEGEDEAIHIQEHMVPTVPVSDRLQSIQQLVADHLGEKPPGFESSVIPTIPVQADSLYPISDVWHIEPGLDEPDRLRIHIAQFAREIADEAGLTEHVLPSDDGIGFTCVGTESRTDSRIREPFPRAVLTLLHVLSAPYHSPSSSSGRIETLHLASDLALLLQGSSAMHTTTAMRQMRLSDGGLVKLFRLLRLARRLLEHDSGIMDGDDAISRS